MARRQEKIVMVTAYDYRSAVIAEEAGVDIVFVGDTLAMVVLGYPSTVPVSLDEMIIFMQAVSRGAHNPLLLGDMPFGSYLSPDQAVVSAARLVKEGGMEAVKLEGGREVCDVVEAVTRRGMPVMGHIGLTPQTTAAHGGYHVKGKKAAAARRLIDDATALEEAGAFAVVLELVPVEVAAIISDRLTVPTIGIGSGGSCDGQVLVWHDMLGLSDVYGRHVKRYANLHDATLEAISEYAADVRAGSFPGDEQTWHMPEDELPALTATA